MNSCYVHGQSAAAGICVHCGKFICNECLVELGGRNYCKNCLPSVLNQKDFNTEGTKHHGAQGYTPPVQHVHISTPPPYAPPRTGVARYECSINRIVAGIFALILGTFGVQKFYMGKIGTGILFVLLCWTGIPSIIGFIEGIIYLVQSDEEFAAKHGRFIGYY